MYACDWTDNRSVYSLFVQELMRYRDDIGDFGYVSKWRMKPFFTVCSRFSRNAISIMEYCFVYRTSQSRKMELIVEFLSARYVFNLCSKEL